MTLLTDIYEETIGTTASGIATSSGIVDAGKIPKLNSVGLLDISFFPSNIGSTTVSGTTISGVTTSSGVEDAGKFTKLNSEGLLDLSFFPSSIINGTVVSGVSVSSGVEDAGKIPTLNSVGLLDISFFPSNIGTTVSGGTVVSGTTISGVTTSSGVVDADKYTKLNSIGKLDISFFPDTALSTSPYVGIVTSESLSAGDRVNVYDYGGAKCRKAYAATSGMEAYGYVVSSVSYGSMATIYSSGNNTAVTGLTSGQQYLSATIPGKCTSTPPSGSGVVLQKVGFASSSTCLTFQKELSIVLAS